MSRAHVTSPDGREWTIRVFRVRLPDWPHSDFEPGDHDDDVLWMLFAYVVLAPMFWIILPLCRVVAETPVAIARSIFSATRWIEAETRWPSDIRILWRTSRDHAEEAAGQIASRLQEGYEDLTPPGAERVSMTRPPGLNDRVP